MKAILSLASAFVASVCVAAPNSPTDPAEHRRAQELVTQLGSAKYREREKAAAELIKMGRASKTALQEGKKHADPEVQTRSQQLLPQALALDLSFRIERYMKDTDGKLDHDLPLIKLYREKVGNDENARALFGGMLKINGALLEAVEEEPGQVTVQIQQHIQEMYQQMFGNQFGGGLRGGGYQPGVLNAQGLCCVLFAAASPAYKPTQPDWLLSNLYTQPNFTNQLKDEKAGSAYRKLFFSYLDARMDDNTINQCVWMLSQHKIKEGADILAKAVKNGKASQVYTKANAMCAVGTLGNKDHLPVFEALIKDDTQVQPFFTKGRQQGFVKVRDVALAMTIHLNGKNPKDYGFEMWNVYPNQVIQYHQLGFGTDEERTAGFKKWEEALKKDPKAEPKKEPMKDAKK
jgi:hypothetical protein